MYMYMQRCAQVGPTDVHDNVFVRVISFERIHLIRAKSYSTKVSLEQNPKPCKSHWSKKFVVDMRF